MDYNEDIVDYLINTDQIEEFLDDKEKTKKEIKEIEEYINKLEKNGIYTEFQKTDLEYHKRRLEQLKNTLK